MVLYDICLAEQAGIGQILTKDYTKKSRLKITFLSGYICKQIWEFGLQI